MDIKKLLKNKEVLVIIGVIIAIIFLGIWVLWSNRPNEESETEPDQATQDTGDVKTVEPKEGFTSADFPLIPFVRGSNMQLYLLSQDGEKIMTTAMENVLSIDSLGVASKYVVLQAIQRTIDTTTYALLAYNVENGKVVELYESEPGESAPLVYNREITIAPNDKFITFNIFSYDFSPNMKMSLENLQESWFEDNNNGLYLYDLEKEKSRFIGFGNEKPTWDADSKHFYLEIASLVGNTLKSSPYKIASKTGGREKVPLSEIKNKQKAEYDNSKVADDDTLYMWLDEFRYVSRLAVGFKTGDLYIVDTRNNTRTKVTFFEDINAQSLQ